MPTVTARSELLRFLSKIRECSDLLKFFPVSPIFEQNLNRNLHAYFQYNRNKGYKLNFTAKMMRINSFKYKIKTQNLIGKGTIEIYYGTGKTGIAHKCTDWNWYSSHTGSSKENDKCGNRIERKRLVIYGKREKERKRNGEMEKERKVFSLTSRHR